MSLRRLPLSALSIRGERAFRAVGPYAALKAMLIADRFMFQVPAVGSVHAHHDRVLFLNLTWWNAGDPSDVLVDDTIDADVVAHAAWHHAARRSLGTGGPPTAAALLLGESIASAFDLYAVGVLLRGGRRCAYLDTQVPALSAAALDAGLSASALQGTLEAIAADPEGAFADLRVLLYDAATALLACRDIPSATRVLDRWAHHRFACFLHHFDLSTWLLYARAYAGPPVEEDGAYAVDQELRAAPVPLDRLVALWLAPPSGGA